ncbi:MAG: ATP-binding protein [Pseudomonadota bacterium]
MPESLSGLFSSEGFMPHGHCYLWTPELLWTYVVADTLIGLAYYSIPLAMLYFVRRRSDLQFSWIFILFSLFIFACGTTHLMAIWTIWHPNYWLDAALKAVTALVSIITAILLWPLIPKALRIPSATQLNALVREREREIEQRKQVEADLVSLNESLERRVAERTCEMLLAQQAVGEMLVKERSAREEAERVNCMKDEFLLTLSHELRTPLNSIFGWTQLLNSHSDDAKMVSKGIEVIDRNVRIQTRLIEDLLDLSAIVSGKIKLDLQGVDLGAMISAGIASIAPTADAKNITFQTDLDPNASSIVADPARMQQVLWNLLTNAIKFTPQGGSITLSLARVDTTVELRVSDSGEGIDAAFLPFVFERFRQADSSTRRRHGGLGVGLAIVKNLIELHGGTVSVQSAGAGQGSSFVLALPCQAIELGAVRPPHARAAEPRHPKVDTMPDLRNLRVLIIDDEEDAREVVRVMLDHQHATTMTAASAAEALACIGQFAPDVILCDIGMPGQDGYDFIRSLREMEQRAPAVAVTAFARAEDRVRSLRAGYKAHLSKPVEPVELAAVLATLTERC